MNKLNEFQDQLAEVDRQIAQLKELREDLCFRIDAEELSIHNG